MDKSHENIEKTDSIRLRCHFSIIFESLWQFWVAIILIVINQIDDVIEFVRSIGEDGGVVSFMREGGFWGLLAILLITFIVLGIQFFRWRKTYIIIEENLVIIERNTLKKYKNTIAMENISAINMERNLFERIVGTYRIKMDTGSLTTANETDVSIVFREDQAVRFRKTVLERMNAAKGGDPEQAVPEERQPDQLAAVNAAEKDILHCSVKDMLKHSLYTLPLLSLLIAVCGIGGACWYISRFGFDSFVRDALGGFIAVVFMVLGSLYNLVKKFLIYYDFTVYRDGNDLHVRCGLVNLRSYTIPVDKITALKIEQPLMSKLFHKYNTKVVTVGIGDEKGESSNITMSLSAEELMFWLKALVPEYVWGEMLKTNREERAGVKVRAVKSVKWHLFFAAWAVILSLLTTLPLLVSIGVPALIDLFILLLYVLSYMSAGYMIREEGLVVSDGYFTRQYSIFKYDRMQIMNMSYHPIAKRTGCGCGSVLLLNSAASIPYIKEELALEISDKMIGGRK